MRDLVDFLKNVKVINNRWVLQMKLNADGLTQWLGARKVMKGHVQKEGTDDGETFSPVALYDTVLAVLAVAALERLQLCQFDVKMAFLYSTLQEEVDMRQPEGFEDCKSWACRLKRSLYGLKQARRIWKQQFADFMKKQRLKVSRADP
jgi:Reverse transcriptase (RNA-dependent DNA polymerase).